MLKIYSDALKKHIESFCGNNPSQLFEEKSTGIYVAEFQNTPHEGLTTYISIGLSNHILSQKSGRPIRQELVMTVDEEMNHISADEIIFSVAKLILENHTSVQLGQVLGPRGLLFPEEPKFDLTSLLCSYPAFFPEEFGFFETGETTVFVEIIPILTGEAEFIQQEGWSAFFDKINNGDIDILDYAR